jgi:hypothetical protein
MSFTFNRSNDGVINENPKKPSVYVTVAYLLFSKKPIHNPAIIDNKENAATILKFICPPRNNKKAIKL